MSRDSAEAGPSDRLRSVLATLCLVSLLAASGPSRADRVLAVKEIFQEHNQWCWAAVSAAVLGYYGKTVSQCVIAEYTRSVAKWHNFGTVDCCKDPSQGCNYWNYLLPVSKGSLPDIIKQFGGVDAVGLTGLLTAKETAVQLDRDQRPFIIRWGKTTSGHFIVIHGITGGDKVHYMDPWYGEGKKIATHAWVSQGGNHTWSHTLTTGSCLCSTKDKCCDGCRAQNQGSACSDGDLCTSNDACHWGACAGAKVTCTGTDQCHMPGACNPATGVCVNPRRRDGAQCDDGNPCSTVDACKAGVCAGETWTRCPPQDPCHHWGVCDPTSGACSAPVKADGTPCTGGRCVQGTCTPEDAGTVVDPDLGQETGSGPHLDGPPLPDLDGATGEGLDRSPHDGATPEHDDPASSGCACTLASARPGAGLILLLALLFMSGARRRRQ